MFNFFKKSYVEFDSFGQQTYKVDIKRKEISSFDDYYQKFVKITNFARLCDLCNSFKDYIYNSKFVNCSEDDLYFTIEQIFKNSQNKLNEINQNNEKIKNIFTKIFKNFSKSEE